ncbi:MAG: globin domain-containing protein [Pseudomonadota bacterium]
MTDTALHMTTPPLLGSEDCERVRENYQQIRPIAGLAAELFAARLAAIAPDMPALVTGDIQSHAARLIGALDHVLRYLDDPERALPAVRDLAARGVANGMTPAMYEPVGEALIFTLARSLDEGFTPAHRTAWQAFYTALSEEMVRSAYATAPTAPITTAAE